MTKKIKIELTKKDARLLLEALDMLELDYTQDINPSHYRLKLLTDIEKMEGKIWSAVNKAEVKL